MILSIEHTNKMNILVTGVLPPPYGGVSIFIKRFLEASNEIENISTDMFSFKSLFLKKIDILHINSSNPVKRFLFVILGRVFLKRVYFTVHGGQFLFKNPFNYLSVLFSNGVFCLNDKVEKILKTKKINYFKHSTVLRENIESIKNNNSLNPIDRKKKVVLFYIQNNKSILKDEIYGAEFIYTVMGEIIDNDIEIIIIDLSQSYAHFFKKKPSVTYIDKPVDFIEILTQSDVYIRPTATDGMSVALLEAGILGVPCLASDVVDRPDFVLTYTFRSESDFLSKLRVLLTDNNTQRKLAQNSLTTISDLLHFMEK